MKVEGIYAYLYTKQNGYDSDIEQVSKLSFDTRYEVREIRVR